MSNEVFIEYGEQQETPNNVMRTNVDCPEIHLATNRFNCYT